MPRQGQMHLPASSEEAEAAGTPMQVTVWRRPVVAALDDAGGSAAEAAPEPALDEEQGSGTGGACLAVGEVVAEGDAAAVPGMAADVEICRGAEDRHRQQEEEEGVFPEEHRSAHAEAARDHAAVVASRVPLQGGLMVALQGVLAAMLQGGLYVAATLGEVRSADEGAVLPSGVGSRNLTVHWTNSQTPEDGALSLLLSLKVPVATRQDLAQRLVPVENLMHHLQSSLGCSGQADDPSPEL